MKPREVWCAVDDYTDGYHTAVMSVHISKQDAVNAATILNAKTGWVRYSAMSMSDLLREVHRDSYRQGQLDAQ